MLTISLQTSQLLEVSLSIIFLSSCIRGVFSCDNKFKTISFFIYIIFIISITILKTLIHMKLSFVQGVKYESVFILLNAAIQFEQHNFLKMLSFFHYVFLDSLTNMGVHSVWIYAWDLRLTPLINVSAFVPIPCFFVTLAL